MKATQNHTETAVSLPDDMWEFVLLNLEVEAEQLEHEGKDELLDLLTEIMEEMKSQL